MKGLRRINRALLLAFFAGSLFFSAAAASGDSLSRGRSASSEADWRILERGKIAFDQGRIGEALIAFEDAARTRAERIATHRKAFIALLSQDEVRRLGDDLSKIEAYAAERKQAAALAALDELYAVVPLSSLGNSARAALDVLTGLAAFPEAEYWIAEAYLAEGETEVALKQYRRAYGQRDRLEVPGEAQGMLLRMAGVRRDRGEYAEMEKLLLEALAEDELWSSAKNAFARTSMVKTLAEDGVDRFLTLFRYKGTSFLAPHRDLGIHYYLSGRHDRAAEHLGFAFLIATTVAIDELKRADFDWAYKTYPSFLASARGREATVSYLDSAKYYETSYYLAASLFAQGNRRAASEIWKAVAARPEAGEWAKTSARQYEKPYVEAPVEKP